jgi:hypothetical protein
VSDAPTVEAGPFGSFLITLAERLLYLPVVTAFCLYVRDDMQPGAADHALPGWYRWGLLLVISCLIFAIIPQWIVPATRITAGGIRRNFARQRSISWDDVADFTITRSWGIRRIQARLLNGRKYSLDGVPLSALPALRHQIGVGGAKSGSWWLVDYSAASSTSSN